jgi:hypothetical protein
MRNTLFGLLLVLTTTVNASVLSENLLSALKKGDATTIANYFDTSIDLSTPRNEGVYSQTQAKLILKTFFTENPSSDFVEVHNGQSKNNSHYSIGNLSTTNGTFRTYILYKKIQNKITILELKIEVDE